MKVPPSKSVEFRDHVFLALCEDLLDPAQRGAGLKRVAALREISVQRRGAF